MRWQVQRASRAPASGSGSASAPGCPSTSRSPDHCPGPSSVLVTPPSLRGGLLLDAREEDAIVWGIGRFVSEELTDRLDTERTVAATAEACRAAGAALSTRRAAPRSVWLWADKSTEDPSLTRIVDETATAPSSGARGAPVERATFFGVPDDLRLPDDRSVAPAEIDERRDMRRSGRCSTDGRLWRCATPTSGSGSARAAPQPRRLAQSSARSSTSLQGGSRLRARCSHPMGSRCSLRFDRMAAFLGREMAGPDAQGPRSTAGDGTTALQVSGPVQVWAAALRALARARGRLGDGVRAAEPHEARGAGVGDRGAPQGCPRPRREAGLGTSTAGGAARVAANDGGDPQGWEDPRGIAAGEGARVLGEILSGRRRATDGRERDGTVGGHACTEIHAGAARGDPTVERGRRGGGGALQAVCGGACRPDPGAARMDGRRSISEQGARALRCRGNTLCGLPGCRWCCTRWGSQRSARRSSQ